MVSVRRLLLLVSMVGAAAAAVAWWQRREAAATPVPEWPPLPDVPTPTAAPADTDVPTPPAAAGHSWVEPDADGACPTSHPVKLNESSGIFHVPGGRFYDRTRADRCYVGADAASADGYRAAKA